MTNQPPPVIVRITVNTQDALNELKEFLKRIEDYKKRIQDAANQSGKSFTDVAEAIKRAEKEQESFNKAYNEFRKLHAGDPGAAPEKIFDTKAMSSALGQLQNDAKSSLGTLKDGFVKANDAKKPFEANLGQLGKIGQFVFGSVLGITAAQAIRAFIEWIKRATQAGIEFNQSQLKLEIAVRALQRAGIVTTIQDWRKEIQLLKAQYPIFSTKELTDAVSLAALMTREFSLTNDQVGNLVKSSLVLSQVTGKDLSESIRGVTYAVGSGYFEALQRAGINISRFAIANEAQRRGLGSAYASLNDNVRVLLTYEAVLKGVEKLQKDSTATIEKYPGAISRVKSGTEDLNSSIGSFFAAAAYPFIRIWGDILELLNDVAISFNKFEASGANALSKIVSFIPGLKGIADQIGVIRDILLGIGGMGDESTDPTAIAEKQASDMLDLWNDFHKQFEQADKEFKDRMKSGQEQFDQDMLDIDEKQKENLLKNQQDYIDRVEEAELDLRRKLEDIQTDYNRSVADENLKYSQSLESVDSDYQDKVAKAAQQYRNNQLKEEQKFQEAMRQLKEKFMMDLEEAVANRDALAIIRLKRQYDIQKGQLEREHELNNKTNATTYQEKLAELAKEREDRLAELAKEHQQRLAAIATQAQREREDAALEHQRKMDDLAKEAKDREEQIIADAAKEREKRKLEWEKLKIQLEQERQARYQLIIDEGIQSGTLTRKNLDDILKIYQEKYGLIEKAQRDHFAQMLLDQENYNKGMAETGEGLVQQYKSANFVNDLQAKVVYAQNTGDISGLKQLLGPGWDSSAFTKDWLQKVIDAINAYRNGNSQPLKDLGFSGRFAEGGSVFANKPTLALFGESGPEVATFTPMSRRGVNVGTSYGSIPAGMSSANSSGMMKMEILLSPGLEYSIIEKALNQVADVVITTQRM